MRRPLAIAITLLICGAIGWLLFGAGEAPSLDANSHAVEAATATSAEPARTAEPTAVPLPEASTAAGRRDAERTPSAGPANLRVVVRGSDAPAAGAVVRYLPPDFRFFALSEDEQRILMLLRSRDAEAFLQRVGRECTTDGDGWCHVPTGKHGTQVTARAAELYGERQLTGKDGPHVLTLRPDMTVHVRVVEADGSPAADVPVELEGSIGSDTFQPDFTSADGRWTWRHVQTMARDGPTCMREISAIPPGIRVAERIDLLAPPTEVLLRLPACGSVTVHVRDAEGKPIDPAYFAEDRVTLAAFERSMDRDQFKTYLAVGRRAPMGANGDAVFAHVGFGNHVAADFWHMRSTASAVGPTPGRPHVEIMLRDSAESAVFVGRLLDADGAPFASQRFELDSRGDGPQQTCFGRTDATGRMRCTFAGGFDGKTSKLTLTTPRRHLEDGLSVHLPPRLVRAGVNDVGDVRLLPDAILVAGRLVCEAGVDVKKVNLRVIVRSKTWTPERSGPTHWEEDGRFSIRGSIAPGEALHLIVPKGSYLPVEPIECTAGTTDIEVRLRAAGELHADLLVDQTVPLDQLEVHLLRTDKDGSNPQRPTSQRGNTDGRVRRSWTGLAAGTYRLSVVCFTDTEPVASVEGLRIVTGNCADQRLQAIDLRGRIRLLEIRAADAVGAPIRDRNAFVVARRPAGAAEPWGGRHLGEGVAALATSMPALNLWVVAPGFEIAAETVTESRTIVLRPASRTRIRLDVPLPLPPGSKLSVQLQPDLGAAPRVALGADRFGGRLDALCSDSAPVAADGTVELPVRWHGAHTVRAKLVLADGRGSELSDLTPKTFALPAAEMVTVRVDQAALERALQPRVR